MENFLEVVEQINSFINGIVWGWPMVILILGTGILLTVRTRFMQVRKFKTSIEQTLVPTFKSIRTKKEEKKENTISPFEAFATAISGTVGTGNIIGVTSAIMTGGPGAVFWMWISAFFGMITNFSENVLGMYFRKKSAGGDFAGGPMYYLREGLPMQAKSDQGRKILGVVGKVLGMMAAVFCALAAIGMSGTQTNKIAGTITGALPTMDAQIVSLIVGIVVAVVLALIILGGVKRIGRVCAILVPFMSLLFIVLALVIIFANVTAIVILVSFGGDAQLLYGGSAVDTQVSMMAFERQFGVFGTVFYTIIIPLFGLTTIIAWSYYGEKAVEYLFRGTGEKGRKISILTFKIVYILLVVVSAVINGELAWAISDTFNGLMALPNLIGLVLMSGLVVKISKNYFMRKKGEDVEPMLSAYPDVNLQFIQDEQNGSEERA